MTKLSMSTKRISAEYPNPIDRLAVAMLAMAVQDANSRSAAVRDDALRWLANGDGAIQFEEVAFLTGIDPSRASSVLSKRLFRPI